MLNQEAKKSIQVQSILSSELNKLNIMSSFLYSLIIKLLIVLNNDVSVDIGRNIIGHWNVFIEILDSCANVMGEFHVGRRFFALEERTQDSHHTIWIYNNDDKHCFIAP